MLAFYRIATMMSKLAMEMLLEERVSSIIVLGLLYCQTKETPSSPRVLKLRLTELDPKRTFSNVSLWFLIKAAEILL